MFRPISIAGVILSMSVLATPVLAANCAQRDKVVDRLETKYSEQLAAGGLQESQTATTVLEVWASPKTGTFTVILTNANGVSCIVAAGTDWFDGVAVQKPEGTAG